MKTKRSKVLMSFQDNLAKLNDRTKAVLSGFYGNPLYPNPPVPEETLQTKYDEWIEGKVEATTGSKLAIAQRNQLHGELVDLMTENALYVTLTCKGNLPNLISSGFEAASDNRAQYPLPTPQSFTVQNGMSGQLVLKTPAIRNANSYEAQHALIDAEGVFGDWIPDGTFTKCREILINNLVPGALYALSIRVNGGSTGASDWSNVMTARSL